MVGVGTCLKRVVPVAPYLVGSEICLAIKKSDQVMPDGIPWLVQHAELWSAVHSIPQRKQFDV